MIIALIFYGSLYPFDFDFSNLYYFDASELLGGDRVVTRRGDVLGNIGLFVPFGAVGMLALGPARSTAARVVLLILAGFFVAAAAQVLQLFLPSRDAALGDILWNLAGCALGVAAVAPAAVRSRLLVQVDAALPLFPLLLLACWAVGTLAPFVPSIDLQAYKESVKPLFALPSVFSVPFLRGCVTWLVLAWLVDRHWSQWAAGLWLACAALATVLARTVIVQNSISASEVLGIVLALMLWPVLRRQPRAAAYLLAGVALFMIVRSLAPFDFQPVARSFSWIPFSGGLSGSMLINVKAMAFKAFLMGTLIYLMGVVGLRLSIATTLVFLLAAVLEVAQLWIGSHTPVITDPLLALALGALMSAVGGTALARPQPAPRPPAAPPRTAPAPPPATPGQDTLYPARGAVIVALLACLSATLTLNVVLGLPQVPYNVRELFGGEDAWWRLFLFSLAGVSVGLGGALVGRVAARSGRVFTVLPLGTLLACLATYLLMVSSVSAESLWDITGSANTHWFVMNRHMWGDAGVWFYEAIGSKALIQGVERFVRFTALFGQATLWIAILSAVYFRLLGSPRLDRRSSVKLGLSTALLCGLAALPLLVAFNLIAFKFSSTDNLNELIDGHGHILYWLLILLPANALVVLHAIRHPKAGPVLAAVGVVAVSLPLGWLLFKNGLSPVVTKYGNVFSGVDFLLGPDREELLPDSVLMGRWFVLQIAAIAALTLGMQVVPGPRGQNR
ncbi:VanZ family protein [Pelagibius sp. 7325]|uniref:VanZ family protein n=1 Tax=Pelagibius sp. 7325 TaxID=3131994 RepID=UPI0030EC313F